MCGRFCIAASPGELSERYDVTIPDTYTPRYNIAPAESILFIPSSSSEHAFRTGRFGFSVGLNKSVINARTETVLEKSLFKTIHTGGRCLIPASGYYEWQHVAGQKIPYYIHIQDTPVISFAGVFRTIQGGDEIVILTSEAEDPVKSIHSRMPLVLSRLGEEEYLAGEEPAQADRIAPSTFQIDRVSERVNKPGIEGPDLIIPVKHQNFQQILSF